jgi:hypothetical protein
VSSPIELSGAWSAVVEHGCEFNALAPDALFAYYGKAGFLDATKLKRLEKHWGAIRENWRRTFEAGSNLHLLVRIPGGPFGTVCCLTAWRSSFTGWNAQHLVSTGNPRNTGHLLLGVQRAMMDSDLYQSVSTWFQPSKSLPALAFGRVVESLGPRLGAVTPYYLYDVRLDEEKWPSSGAHIRVERCTSAHETHEALLRFRKRCFGPASTTADEFSDDLDLEKLDAVYARWGLRRYRRNWIARSSASGQVLGALSAYRGPLGLNFSLLENRAEIVIDSSLEQAEDAVIWALLRAARGCYADFEAAAVPVLLWAQKQRTWLHPEVTFIREYHRGVWLREAFPEWYRRTAELHEQERNTSRPPAGTSS